MIGLPGCQSRLALTCGRFCNAATAAAHAGATVRTDNIFPSIAFQFQVSASASRASLTVRITFPEVRNRKGTESGLASGIQNRHLHQHYWSCHSFHCCNAMHQILMWMKNAPTSSQQRCRIFVYLHCHTGNFDVYYTWWHMAHEIKQSLSVSTKQQLTDCIRICKQGGGRGGRALQRTCWSR